MSTYLKIKRGQVEIVIKGRIPSKKNSKRWLKRGGRQFLVPSKKHEEWHKRAYSQVIEQNTTKSLVCRGVLLRIWFPDNRDCDLTNKAESVMDLLVDSCILKDDNWKCTGSVHLIPMGVDKENPRCEITLMEVSK